MNSGKEKQFSVTASPVNAYADDVAVLARDRNSLKETTTLIEKEENKRGIYINEHKTKYMREEDQLNIRRRILREEENKLA